MEILVAIISAVGGLFIFQQLVKYNTNKRQSELEATVKKLEQQASDLQKKNDEIDKDTKDKVDVISKEQDKNLSGSDLVDWFNKRKGGR